MWIKNGPGCGECFFFGFAGGWDDTVNISELWLRFLFLDLLFTTLLVYCVLFISRNISLFYYRCFVSILRSGGVEKGRINTRTTDS